MLEAVDVALDWPLYDHPAGITLGYRLYRNNMSVLRELISNILRHASAKRVRVDIQVVEGQLVTVVEDDGTGLDSGPGSGRQGHGLDNLRRRLADMNGDAEWSSSAQGTRVRFSFPLPV